MRLGLFVILCLALVTPACTAVLGLDDYKPLPKDSGIPADGAKSDGGTDGGTCTPYSSTCEACRIKKCGTEYGKCMTAGKPCEDLQACQCACADKACFRDCDDKAPSSCQLCKSGLVSCEALECTSECD